MHDHASRAIASRENPAGYYSRIFIRRLRSCDFSFLHSLICLANLSPEKKYVSRINFGYTYLDTRQNLFSFYSIDASFLSKGSFSTVSIAFAITDSSTACETSTGKTRGRRGYRVWASLHPGSFAAENNKIEKPRDECRSIARDS